MGTADRLQKPGPARRAVQPGSPASGGRGRRTCRLRAPGQLRLHRKTSKQPVKPTKAGPPFPVPSSRPAWREHGVGWVEVHGVGGQAELARSREAPGAATRGFHAVQPLCSFEKREIFYPAMLVHQLILYVWLFCLHICLCATCGPVEVKWPLGVTTGSKSPCGC